jgi:myo-inositol-1(or 4)-monophosphatase
MHPMLNIAIKAARRAGQIIMRHAEQLDRLTVEKKGVNDFVSQVDRQAEAEIIHILHAAYPSHSVLAEESGQQAGDEYQWIIDPLDGTTNFLHGYPSFSVSIALQHRGRLEHAVVFDPVRNELFTASRGQGAQLNERRVRVSRVNQLSGALLGTGFPFKTMEYLEVWINTFRTLLPLTSGVRRAGSAALDLAHVASGRLDGFWEIGLNPWDMAAGCLLIQEAGGFIGDFSGEQAYLETGNIIAGNPKIYGEILRLIQPHVIPALRPPSVIRHAE